MKERSISELADSLEVAYLLADPTDDTVLVQAGIANARGLIAAMPDDRDNLAVVIGAKALANRFENTSMRIMSRVEDNRYMRKLYLSGADFARIPAVMGGYEMAAHIMNPEIAYWWYSQLGGEERMLRFGEHALTTLPSMGWQNCRRDSCAKRHYDSCLKAQ